MVLGMWLTRVFQSSYLKFSVMMTLGFLVLSFTYPFVMKVERDWGTRPAPVEPYEAVLLALLMIGALAVTLAIAADRRVDAGLGGTASVFLFVVLRS